MVEFHGQRSLADYSPWGLKESNTVKPVHININTLNLFVFRMVFCTIDLAILNYSLNFLVILTLLQYDKVSYNI